MLGTRIITAIFLVTGLLAGLFWLPAPLMSLVFVGIVALAAWEWAGLLQASPTIRIVYALVTGGLCLALLAAGLSEKLPEGLLSGLWLLAVMFWVCLVPLWFRYQWRVSHGVAGWLVGGLLLVPSWAAMVTLHQRSPWLLLAAMALVWVADIAAYFAGRTLGRHKLAPTISPGKTWEGAVGAVAGVLLYAAILARETGVWSTLGGQQWLVWLLGLLVLTAVSIIGDLFESLAKRQAGVKDSSALLPGHGGVLDRIDSLTSTLPLVALAVTQGALSGVAGF
ncbi:MAG: phosphatidate cytidylyltransferase [Sterolibacterium sp.]|nr:phosphatidate cytidylyltransferase [Sterolibacterium sp.]MBP9799007.1 phosphatidate cytidylyltransferase [Sterolibacterium sp.]